MTVASLLLLLLLSPESGQDRAAAIVSKAIEAAGGRSAFSELRSLRVTGTVLLEAAERDQQRIQEWDNGLLSIWQVDLSPWLDPAR